MGSVTISISGDSIISALGFGAAENYTAVKAGHTGLRQYSFPSLPEPFVASMIDNEALDRRFAAICDAHDQFTKPEKAAILSISDAAKQTPVDLSSPRTVFIVSTTKGNVHLLENKDCNTDAVYLWHSAAKIAGFFGNTNTPVVISNACISGACAQIEAQRRLSSGEFDCAVVTGVDMLSPFIVAGFQSFKALSANPCRPFDANHDGLNLGEAAATIVFQRQETSDIRQRTEDGGQEIDCQLVTGTVRNDANHISGPSRTGEGSFRALKAVLQNVDTEDIAFINAHGTATVYNDSMEAVAIERAGLQNLPVNGLKGCFGHTLGAAGLVESIISLHALADGVILPTLGFEYGDDDLQINVNRSLTPTDKSMFIKMLSGFGGCNAALLFRKTKTAK